MEILNEDKRQYLGYLVTLEYIHENTLPVMKYFKYITDITMLSVALLSQVHSYIPFHASPSSLPIISLVSEETNPLTQGWVSLLILHPG